MFVYDIIEKVFDDDDFSSNKSEAIHYDHEQFINETKSDKISCEIPAQIYLTKVKSLQSLNAVFTVINKKVENTALLNFANIYTSNISDQNNYNQFKNAYDKRYYPLSCQEEIEIDLPSIL